MPDKPKDDERVSLHGHDPEEVLKALLKVKPEAEAEPVEDDPAPPHGDRLRDLPDGSPVADKAKKQRGGT
jgi:hypothetical protein